MLVMERCEFFMIFLPDQLAISKSWCIVYAVTEKESLKPNQPTKQRSYTMATVSTTETGVYRDKADYFVNGKKALNATILRPFNPRARIGARHEEIVSLYSLFNLQSTRPHRGATKMVCGIDACRWNEAWNDAE